MKGRTPNIEEKQLRDKLLLFELENERRTLRVKRTIFLAEEVCDGTAENVMKDIEILSSEGKGAITLIIASAGGGAFPGYAIIRAIRRAQGKGIKFIGQVHGHAMSMAFFILQCCDERVMGKMCNLMCHGITTFTTGDMKNVEAERKIMLKFQEEIAQLVADRNTAKGTEYKEQGYWHAILEDNTPQFYDYKEALEMGLIDRVED